MVSTSWATGDWFFLVTQIKRIIHIITSLDDGGAEAVLYRLCAYGSQHNNVVLSLRDEGKYGPLLETAGVKVHCLNMPKGRVTICGLARLWSLLRTLRPDVVQTWMYHSDFLGGVFARLAGVPRVCWGIHNTTLEPGKSTKSTIWVSRISSYLSRWVPHVIVCCAEKSRDVHVALGYSAKKMVLIPNGYDLSRFIPDLNARERLRSAWNLEDDTFLIGMVSRFDPHKDHFNLIDALGMLRNRGIPFVCVLIGKDLVPENAILSNYIASHQLGEHVRLLGQRSDIPDVMNALDVHVLSSSAEAFPNVIAEAMACGTPCVTTDVGDASLIVGETGWVVSPRNPQDLAEAIESAFNQRSNSEWALRCHAARQRIVDNFSIGEMVARYRRAWFGV